tara:strand:- start:466 stop:627 length:162 start_codon:yes stop_codon:yes gene_type:complete
MKPLVLVKTNTKNLLASFEVLGGIISYKMNGQIKSQTSWFVAGIIALLLGSIF